MATSIAIAEPDTSAEWVQAHRANALFDAHREDLECGYRLLVDEAGNRWPVDGGPDRVADLLGQRLVVGVRCSVFGKPKAYAKARKAGAPAEPVTSSPATSQPTPRTPRG